MKSVVQYFQETYGFTIQHTNLPCLQVGNQQRPNYLPMEVRTPYYLLLWIMIFLINIPFRFIDYKSIYNKITKIICADFFIWFKVCKIVEGQRYSKRLNERQITALLKVTCQRPQERELDILQVHLV